MVCTSFYSFSPSKPNADPIKKVLKEMAKTNIYEYSTTFKKDAVLPEQMNRYTMLKEMASPERLISIVKKDKNAVVRLYAYMALVSSLKSVPADVLQQMNGDQTIVQTNHENISGSETVATIAKTFLY
jgi:hypothetical protein